MPHDNLRRLFAAGSPDAVRQAYDLHGRLTYTLCLRALEKAMADAERPPTTDHRICSWG